MQTFNFYLILANRSIPRYFILYIWNSLQYSHLTWFRQPKALLILGLVSILNCSQKIGDSTWSKSKIADPSTEFIADLCSADSTVIGISSRFQHIRNTATTEQALCSYSFVWNSRDAVNKLLYQVWQDEVISIQNHNVIQHLLAMTFLAAGVSKWMDLALKTPIRHNRLIECPHNATTSFLNKGLGWISDSSLFNLCPPKP